MIHKACMPVYMNSGIIGAGRDGWTGKSKVLQEVLADLKRGQSLESLGHLDHYIMSIHKIVFRH